MRFVSGDMEAHISTSGIVAQDESADASGSSRSLSPGEHTELISPGELVLNPA